jgi:hypothetical protein
MVTTSNDPMFFISLATAIFTGIYMFLTLLIWRAMLSANRKTEAALSETRRSNELTEDALQFAHRPSLHFSEAHTPITGNDEQRVVTVSLDLTNTGTDTASNVFGGVAVSLALPTRADVEEIRPGRPLGDVGVGVNLGIQLSVADSQIGALHDAVGSGYLTAAVVVTYSDAFANFYGAFSIQRFTGSSWAKVDEWRRRVKAPDGSISARFYAK